MKAEIITGMSPAEYFAIDAMSSSAVRGMAQPKPTRGPSGGHHFDIGNALDALETRPDLFDEMIIPPPVNPKTGNPYGPASKAWADYVAANPGKAILSDKEVALVQGMSRALRAQPEYAAAHAEGSFQDVILFEYEGHPAKAMLDIRVGSSLIVDIKTAAEAHYWGFYRSARKFYYDIQAYWYRYAVHAALGVTPDFMFAVVDKGPGEPGAALYLTEPADCMDEWVASLVERVAADDWSMPDSKQVNTIQINREFEGEPVLFGGKAMAL